MVIFNFRSIVVVNTELNSTWWTQTFVGEERKIDRDRVGEQEKREERKREQMEGRWGDIIFSRNAVKNFNPHNKVAYGCYKSM